MRIEINRIELIRERNVNYGDTLINKPEKVTEIVNRLFNLEASVNEKIVLLSLDIKNQVRCASVVSEGSENASIIDPCFILKKALLEGAKSIIIVHNHPSGNPSPSVEDTEVTKRMKQACDIIGLGFIDHVIIGDGRSYSFKEYGLI